MSNEIADVLAELLPKHIPCCIHRGQEEALADAIAAALAAASPDTAEVDVPAEPGMTWNGSYQQAYLRGHADAARGVPVGSDPADPMPYVSLAPAWAMLAGYVDQTREDGDRIDPTELLAVMRDFKADAYKPVHEWWHRTFGDHPSPWEATS